MDRRIKKDAFYVYKAYWSKAPFVHLCGSRYTDRAEDVTEIKVYSNQKKVSLFVDGAEKETKEGARIFRFRVPITGTHTIRAVSGDCTDEITVRKVDTPNPDYIFNKQGDVVNWFDKEDFKADHYSISDTLGELAKNEIYARHGRKFVTQRIADYFNSKSWYKGTVEPETFDADTSVFNEYEVANIQKIADTEGKLRSEGK